MQEHRKILVHWFRKNRSAKLSLTSTQDAELMLQVSSIHQLRP